MKLGFGKYATYEISEVPEEYLEWLIRASEDKIKLCNGELERRELASEANMSWMERIFKTGYRELCKRHHPDAGGTTAEMQEINAAYEAIKRAMS
jgi:uncharacterized protein (DUF3820 family)